MKSWLSARKFCRDKYIDLASVHSLDQNDKLHRLLAKASVKNAWIGLFDDSALWKWSLDGAVFNNSKDYSFWRPDSPQRTTGISSCVTVSPQGYWRDAKCTVVFPSVCYNSKSYNQSRFQYRTAVLQFCYCKNLFFFLSILETGPTKYIFINNTKTFYRAKLHCKALHSGLASIRNQTEQDLVTDVLTRRAWIGLNRRRFQLWSNSQYVKYTNWDGVQPDLPKTLKRRCGLVSATSGKWSEEGCGKEHHFICEKPSRVHKVKLKMKFQSSADMNDPEVIRQIRQQVLLLHL